MKCWPNLPIELTAFGTYVSQLGGSRKPCFSSSGEILFEVIQEGSVYGLEQDPVLHGEGAVFSHRDGQHSVSVSPEESYYSCYVLRFSYGTVPPPLDWPRVFQWRDRKAMHVFMQEMLHAFHSSALDRSVVGNLILARLAFEQERARELERGQGIHRQLGLATDFINRNFSRPLSLEDVAQAGDLSVSHLHTLFRDHLGETPHQYIIQRRMREASHALATGPKPIKALAADVGYPNAENFCRTFRKFFGCTAGEYRQAHSR